jgi:hypothetical protein
VKARTGWLTGLVLGAFAGLSVFYTINWHKALPGLVFAVVFWPWGEAVWRKLAAAALSTGVWWICFMGAGNAAKGMEAPHEALDQLLFWGRWGAQGGLLLSVGLLLLGFEGLRSPKPHLINALAGAAFAQAFWAFGNGDAAFIAGFVLWQGGIGALLTYQTQGAKNASL